MFNTPPRSSRHYETTVRTRSAWKKEELIQNMMKEDPTRDVKSDILKKGELGTAFSVQSRPKTEGDCLKKDAHSFKPVSSKKYSNSSKSIEAKKKQLEFEAAQKKAEIERKVAQLEKSLVEQKLAADIAALKSTSSQSRRSSQYQPTEIDSAEKVQQWLEDSQVANGDRAGKRDVTGGSGTDMQNLVSAIYKSNMQSKQLMSRFASSKDLPQFYGDPLEWLAYKQAYDESTKICKYSDAENMWRLRKSLKGEAKETVSSLLIGTTAPQTIIEALELRYGRPETIIHKITYQLKKIQPLSQNYHHEIVSFSIKIKNFVAAAKAVKQTDYLRSPEMVSSVLTKCPSALINKWADYYSANCNIQKAKLEVLAEFLYNEATKISAAGLTHLHSQSDYRKKPEDRKQHSVLISAKRDVIISCRFCKVSNHKLPDCARFKRAMTKDRWRFVRINNLCHKCLLATHSRDTCSAMSCPVDECGLPHHRLLHWKIKTSANSAKSDKSDSNPTSKDNNVLISDKIVDNDCSKNNETVAHATNSSNSCVFLKVVPVNIHGPKGVLRTHALLDDGATVSLISADIADRVDLHGQKQTLCVRGAWDSELMCNSEKIMCKITSINNESFELSARKISELNLPLQKLSNIKIKDYEHLNHLIKYISCSENVKPMLLIGQDNYHLIAPMQTIIRNKNEPCATLTPLGWCVHGVCVLKRQYSSARSECAMITVEQMRRPPTGASGCKSRHACTRAATNTSSLAAVAHTGTCEITADTSPHHTITAVSSKAMTTECKFCYRKTGSIHTDQENDEQLHELVRKSFMFESIGVHSKPRQNKDELKAIQIVEKYAKLADGKWEVGLPWKDENAKMASSFCNAYRRLQTIGRKMASDEGFALRYKERIEHLFVNGYARKIDPSENDHRATKIWYLPHFGVDNPNKKKLRLVFDAAATSGGQCLNDYLLQGPDLLESLLGIMLRFRERPIGLTGDIKDMFLRIKIKEDDQNALRFLWRDNQNENQPIQKCKMTSLIFGANCSPFIAQHIKNLNAQRFVSKMPEAVTAIIKSHYMDDYIDCFYSVDTALKTMRDVTYIHKQGNFEIRNWTSNEPQVCQHIPKEALSEAVVNFKTEEDSLSERILGLLWYPKTDTFGFNLSLQKIPEKILKCTQEPTKRELLRIVMSIFDIYGLLTPFTIKAKIIIQDTWKSNTHWDECIPTKQFKFFQDWMTELHEIKDIRIPRWYFRSRDDSINEKSLTDRLISSKASETTDLHIFCDASPTAYAAVAYWRVHTENKNVCVSFIASKSRVAPIKPTSIPRLELQGAVLACRLADVVQKEHRMKANKRYFWTDSMTVLHWIQNDTRNYKTFVANRLGEIDELSKINEWHYIRSDKNIADVASKYTNYKLHKDCEWFQGPNFLYEKEDSWTYSAPEKEKIKINEESLEMVHHVHTTERDSLPVPDPEKFSSWLRLLRCTATVLLFVEKTKKTCKKEIDTEILQRAERLLIRYAQTQSFSTEIHLLKNNSQIQPDSRLRTLTPYLDEWGILRVGGRVEAANDVSSDMKRPIILDGRNHIARLLTKNYHEKSAHGNNEMVVNELRQRYWLLNLRPTVRTVASQCLFCRIKRATPSVPRMADLPEARLAHHQRAFTHCGVDLFGPMEITVGRRRERRYGVLFTCMTVRAVHIEVVPSLTTDSFIMSLRRMASRRGWPHFMYSDNGTNLRGADTELRKSFQELDQSSIKEQMTNRGVVWSFSSPISPHKGGAWERLIRSVKTALKITLKERAPKEETLMTLLAEVENMVNSRPLTHVSVDPSHMEALTPNHFLIGSSSNLPVPGIFDDGDLYLKKMWRTAQRLADLFWQRWVKEVLPDLLPRQKWYKEGGNLKPGDLVIMIDPNFPRNTWPKGIVERVFPGTDGRIRTVEIKTKNGVLTRPVTRLALLPVENSAPEVTLGGECRRRTSRT